MRKERTHYSREFKLKAVELSNQRGNLTERKFNGSSIRARD